MIVECHSEICCGSRTGHSLQRRPSSCPEVLLVQIRRGASDGSVLRFPLIVEDQFSLPGCTTLRLEGVVYHVGPSADSGHYTCACRGPDGFFWYFDDSCRPTRLGAEVSEFKMRSVVMLAYGLAAAENVFASNAVPTTEHVHGPGSDGGIVPRGMACNASVGDAPASFDNAPAGATYFTDESCFGQACPGKAPFQGEDVADGQAPVLPKRRTPATSAQGVREQADVPTSPVAWRRFTPMTIDQCKCQARTWAGGNGGQCGLRPAASSMFCNRHVLTWEAHGQVTGPIPKGKLAEFIAHAKRRGKHEVAGSDATSSCAAAQANASVGECQPQIGSAARSSRAVPQANSSVADCQAQSCLKAGGLLKRRRSQ